MRKKPGFFMKHEWLDLLDGIDDAEEFRQLVVALFQYSLDGSLDPELGPQARVIFRALKKRIDEDAARYDEVCKKRQDVGRLGGRPPKTKHNQMVLNESNNNQMVSNESNEKHLLQNQQNQNQKTPSSSSTKKGRGMRMILFILLFLEKNVG